MKILPKVKPGWVLVLSESDEYYGEVQWRDEDGQFNQLIAKRSVSRFLGSNSDYKYRFVGDWKTLELVK